MQKIYRNYECNWQSLFCTILNLPQFRQSENDLFHKFDSFISKALIDSTALHIPVMSLHVHWVYHFDIYQINSTKNNRNRSGEYIFVFHMSVLCPFFFSPSFLLSYYLYK